MCVYIDFPLSNCCALTVSGFLTITVYCSANYVVFCVEKSFSDSLGSAGVSLGEQKTVHSFNHLSIFNTD